VPRALRAQLEDLAPERWTIYGSAGFDLRNTILATLGDSGKTLHSGANTGLLGDLRLNANGFLFDPKFLQLNLGFNGSKGTSSTDIGAMDNSGISWAVTSALLPHSRMPLRVYYANSRIGTSGLQLDQTSNDSRLGVDWTLTFAKIPRVTLGLQRYVSEVVVPLSASNVSYRQFSWSVGLSDTWKNWDWSLGLADARGNSQAFGGLDLGGLFHNNDKSLNFSANRSFWQRKGNFATHVRDLGRHDQLGTLGASNLDELLTSSVLSISHSQKLSTNYTYGLTRVSFSQEQGSNPQPGGPAISLVPFTNVTAHSLGAGASYQAASWLRIGPQARYSVTTPIAGVAESRTSLADLRSSVSTQKTWHGVDVSGTYTPLMQRVGTSKGRSASSFSNNFDGRVAWGEERNLRLTGSGRISRMNIVEQIGGFSEEREFSLQGVTRRLRSFTVRGGAGRTRVELLNFSGQTAQSFTNYDLGIEHKKFGLSYSQNLGDGAGAVFPGVVREPDLLIFPLPISTLIGTPLLNRTTRAKSANFVLRLNHSLDLRANWRVEKDLFFVSRQDYRNYEIMARYRIGKVTIEGGLGSYRALVDSAQTISGNKLNRYYLRIARDFRIR